MVPVELAWKALASMPCCMLWPEMRAVDALSCFLFARRIPTRKSPFSPLKQELQSLDN